MRVKLVRDLVERLDDEEEIRSANSRAGKTALLCLKMHEEAQEISHAPWDPAEYADLLEVLSELMRLNGVDLDDVVVAGLEKRRRLGAFYRGRTLVRPGPDAG